jgi:hypothetical protein
MFDINLEERGVDLSEYVRGLAAFRPDFSDIRDEVERLVRRAVALARVAGVDKDGQMLFPISEEGWKTRTRRGRGFGPPLASEYTRSSSAEGLDVRIETRPSGLAVLMSYSRHPYLLAHKLMDPRFPNRPIRDISGIPEEYWADVVDKVAEEALKQWGSPGFLGGLRRFVFRR